MNIGEVSPFYALLMMDGDSLGKHMSEPKAQDAITKGLAEFTQRVPHTVNAHNGFLIYAGGDDVMAVLPLEDAFSCAKALRDVYLECFKKHPLATGEPIPTTLSGAIEFAHIKTPLTTVLKDAHHL